ncbi:ABC transporter ATP-binding protein [Oceanobacillus sp. 1P07AA]|uniref:ABC transporter ATP-binding protein n=1 Tax=Oceanobacillus sp. 1P07AA TaxID=3132293 RepID=UPI0039A40ABB
MNKAHLDQPLFKLDNFSFVYNTNQSASINQLSLSIYEDEITILMGASGSGKSTLALCLNGLYPEAVEGTTKGTFLYKGKAIDDYPRGVINQEVGIVFQDPESQFCMVRVEDELAFVLENLSIPRSEMKRKIRNVLQQLGMLEYMNTAIHHLSGGQKQKIALASVLLMEPRYIILDEPTANLDPMSRLEFIELIIEIQKKTTIGILIIEHQVDDWEIYADRLVILSKETKILIDEKPETAFQVHQTLLRDHQIAIPMKYLDNQETIRKIEHKKSMPMCLEVHHLHYFQRKSTILKDISFSIQQGEFIAILGENGAGKSTLLQCLIGLKKYHSGNILFQGKDLQVWDRKTLSKHTGFVFQQPEHQFICDTVFDEVAFGMRLNNYSTSVIHHRTISLLRAFRLLDHQWKNPFTLSGGQKRRLSVATMLDETPDLLLFDEPTFGQDAHTTRELMNMILELQSQGTAIIFVTHDMDLVDTYCDRALVMNKGIVSFDGSPQSLWNQKELLQDTRLREPYRIRECRNQKVVRLR